MTTPADPPRFAAHVEMAETTDIEVLSHVIADAFFDLAVSQWLVPEPQARRAIFPSYFRIFVERTFAEGLVLTTPARDAAALWIPVGPDGPGEPPEEYHDELAILTGRRLGRFQALDEAFERHHPVGVPHDYLAILAVRPDRQRSGIGTAILNARHAHLDRDGTSVYLEASDAVKREIYRKQGYADLGEPIQLPDGPPVYPMWRPPVAPATNAASPS